jgi:RNA polymerase sigma factor (sigma-70 family)
MVMWWLMWFLRWPHGFLGTGYPDGHWAPLCVCDTLVPVFSGWHARGSIPAVYGAGISQSVLDEAGKSCSFLAMDVTHDNSQFPPTRWTRVLKMQDPSDPKETDRALADLCKDYWYPLYAFARRMGRTPHDAQDLTQGFFAYAVERNLFSTANKDLGRLRTFLLTAFRRYMGDIKDKEQALKRGGGREILSLNMEEGEDRYVREPSHDATPEVLFGRSWALSVIMCALKTLRDTECAAGRAKQFAAIEPFLSPDSVNEGIYKVAADELGTNEESVRQIVSRLRKRFRDHLRDQIAGTLQERTEEQINDELMELKAALR